MKHFNTRHGQYVGGVESSEIRAFINMHSRCYNPRNASFIDYGARGITVCSRWATFDRFIADMGLKPGPKYSLGRIDGDKGYSPSNCRWETSAEQNRNRRPLKRGKDGRYVNAD